MRELKSVQKMTNSNAESSAMEVEENNGKSLAEQKKDEGNEFYKTKNYRDALQRYTEAIDLDPECPAYYGNRSACHMMLGQYGNALNDARTSVDKDSTFVKGHIRIAKCAIALGDIMTAKAALESAAANDQGSSKSAIDAEKNNVEMLDRFKEEAKNAYELADYRKSLYCLDRALAIATGCRQLKVTRSECLAFLGRYPEAVEVANDLLRADSLNADAMYVRGLCLYYEDNVDKAVSHFTQVLRLAPDHAKAKAAYKKVKQLKSTKDEGNAAFKEGAWAKAYDLYTQALSIDSCNKFTNAKLYFNRGACAAQLKKYSDSVSDCTSAIELDENYLKAYLRRAKSNLELEEYDEAVRDFEKVHRMDRSNPEYRRLLSHAKLELKKSKRKDYYKILGVGKDAGEDEIKKAYRKRALVHHPDRHASASEAEKKEHEKKFKEIGEAYGVLSDSKKKARYDNGHDIDDLEGCSRGGGGFSHGGDIDPNHIFQAFFGGGMGGGMPGAHFGGGGQAPGGFTFQFG